MHRSALMTAAWVCLAAGGAYAAQTTSSSPQSQQQQKQQDTPQTQAGRSDQNEHPNARRVNAIQPSAQVKGQRTVQVALVTAPGRIAATPGAYYGVPVSVHGQVARVYNTHSFAIDSDRWWAGGDNLLVLLPQPSGGAPLNQDEFVTVVGTVQPFVRAEFERDYDWFDFDDLPDINIEFEGRPVIVADLARTSSGQVLAQPKQQSTQVLIATPGDIAQTPGRFYGRTVAVRQEVENVSSSRAFTLDEDRWFAGPDLLVFNPNPIFTGRDDFDDYDGEQVTVFGTVRPLIVSEFEQDYDWFNLADYQGVNLNDRERRPVIIASSIISDAGFELVRFTPDLALDRAQGALAARAEGWPDMTARYDRRSTAQPQRAREPQTRMEAQRPSNQQAQASDAPQAAQPQAQQSNPIRDLGMLSAQNADQMAGRRVQFERVEVQAVLGDGYYRVGSDEQGVAVRVPQQTSMRIAVGDFLQLSGTVMRAGGQANVSGPVYIDAQQVTRVQ